MREGTKLEVTSATRQGVRVIAVEGDIDLSSLEEVQAHVDAAFADGATLLVIDLGQVPFLDSAVLHALERTLRRARRAGGDMAIACPDPGICRMLEVFGLSRDIAVRDDPDAAVAAVVGG